MNPTQIRNAEYAFSQMQEAYKKLTIPEAKNYYLTLGNKIEVHLIRADGRKSVFLGRLVINSSDDMKPVVAAVWNTLKNYFMREPEPVKKVEEVKPTEKIDFEDFSKDVPEHPEEKIVEAEVTKPAKTQKRASEKTAVDEIAKQMVAEPEEIDDGFEPDTETEDSFDEWADKMAQ